MVTAPMMTRCSDSMLQEDRAAAVRFKRGRFVRTTNSINRGQSHDLSEAKAVH